MNTKLIYRNKLLAISALIFPALALGVETSTELVIGQGAPVLAPESAPPEIQLLNDADNNGVVSVGDTIEVGPLTFTDPDGDAFQLHYTWYHSGTSAFQSNGPWVVPPQAEGITITGVIVSAWSSSTSTDPYTGQNVQGRGGNVDPDRNGQFTIAKASEIVSLAIEGFVNGYPQVGTTLTAVPTCVGECPAQINYNWQIENAIDSETFVDIPGATGSTYTPVGSDQRRKIRAIIKS